MTGDDAASDTAAGVSADVAASAAAFYADRFGGDPAGVWRAPGRVNLIGEHTDYNDGFALPFALGAGVCVAAGRREDGRDRKSVV